MYICTHPRTHPCTHTHSTHAHTHTCTHTPTLTHTLIVVWTGPDSLLPPHTNTQIPNAWGAVSSLAQSPCLTKLSVSTEKHIGKPSLADSHDRLEKLNRTNCFTPPMISWHVISSSSPASPEVTDARDSSPWAPNKDKTRNPHRVRTPHSALHMGLKLSKLTAAQGLKGSAVNLLHLSPMCSYVSDIAQLQEYFAS